MKNKIILSLILMLSLFGLTGCNQNTDTPSTGDNTPVEANPNKTTEDKPVKEPNIKEPTKVVSISNNRGLNEVEINGVVIKDVIIVNSNGKQQVQFTIESNEPLTNMLIEVSLLNETVVNKSMNLTVGDGEYSKFVIFDFTNMYNNPFQIYFNIEKN